MDPVVDAARVKAAVLIVVPGDAQPYDPARLSAALRGAPIVTTAQGGPTLLITGPPPASDPSNPVDASHEHGAGPPAAKAERDAEAIAKVTAFVTTPSP
ncbi:MAG: hypothetical protein M3144_01020 [Actinomycetota bacterium]|nr:hypothetical protein [Actinomycetota bacterium]